MVAPIQFNDIPWLVIMLFLMLVSVICSMHHGGLFSRQTECLHNIQSERTFSDSQVTTGWGIVMMTLCYMLLFGLLLFSATHEDAPALLSSPSLSVLVDIGLSVLVPLGWFLLQWFLFNWVCYLFDVGGKAVIFNRVYLSVFVLAMPIALLLFIAMFLLPIPAQMLLILLTALFILTQIACIFNAFRIFMVDYVSGFVIFVYLCTLEIAPLAFLCSKLGGIVKL